ncbi:hypothetical protein GCM10028808_43620 [Spirosoma migulaei]
MFRTCVLILPVSLLALLNCHPKTADQLAVSPVTPTASTGSLSRSMPDSIATYQPVFGVTSTAQQFPFGQSNQPGTTLRLTQVTYNGKLWLAYQYDAQNRLSERTTYYLDGIHIYVQFAYSYAGNNLLQVASKLNKEAPYLEGSPQNNDLLPSKTIMYSPIDNGIAGLTKITNTVFTDWYQKTGIEASQLGFNSEGMYIWSGIIDNQGKRQDNRIYRRNEKSNALWDRIGTTAGYWTVDYFTYDTHPNPFRTTGDSEMIDMNDMLSVNSINSNNVITRQTINEQGGRDDWRYEYQYRPDGYPSQLKAYRHGMLTTTLEYTYNQ